MTVKPTRLPCKSSQYVQRAENHEHHLETISLPSPSHTHTKKVVDCVLKNGGETVLREVVSSVRLVYAVASPFVASEQRAHYWEKGTENGSRVREVNSNRRKRIYCDGVYHNDRTGSTEFTSICDCISIVSIVSSGRVTDHTANSFLFFSSSYIGFRLNWHVGFNVLFFLSFSLFFLVM